MSILYVFTVTCPENVQPFPPSVTESSWFTGWLNYLTRTGVNNGLVFQVIFDSESALNSYIDTYKCTDATMLADISAWKSTYGITYNSAYYALNDAGISPTPDPIVS